MVDLPRLPEQRFERIGIVDVRFAHRERAIRGGGGPVPVRLAAPGGPDFRARGGAGFRRRQPDAGGAADDYHRLVIEIIHCCEDSRFQANTRPGLRMPRGSRLVFRLRIRLISRSSRLKGRKGRFMMPMPCSAETEPFSSRMRP